MNDMATLKQKFDKMTDGPLGYVIYAALGIMIAFLLNQGLAYALDTDLPVVAVISSSMTHDNTTPIVFYQWLENNMGYNESYINSWPVHNGFVIGDLPIIQGEPKYNVGDVIVYSIPDQKVPIIHRIIKINPDGTYMTKGDHNPTLLPFEGVVMPQQIHGKVIFIIPKLGYFKVIMTQIAGAQGS